jgi:hypothetical protein
MIDQQWRPTSYLRRSCITWLQPQLGNKQQLAFPYPQSCIYHHTGHTELKHPACNNAYQRAAINQQWLSTLNQEQFIHIASANEEQWTTFHANPQRNHHLTGHAILHHWITHHWHLLGLQPDTASSTVHFHYAHTAHTATSTDRTGRPHQPDSQVQPTHALMITDSKVTHFSKYHYHIQLGHLTTLI